MHRVSSGLLFFLIWISVAGIAKADDIDLLGASAVQVEPNVLIIFDTSASMAIEDIPDEPYQRDIDYGKGNGFERDAVYRWQQQSSGGGWIKLLDRDALDQSCQRAGIAGELAANGQTWGRINTGHPYDCGEQYDDLDLRLGNYLNYEDGALNLPVRSRLDTAKAVIKQIIDDHPEIRFGLMRFNEGDAQTADDTEGGRLTEHGDINLNPTTEQLKADVDALTAETFTPLAETLAEAGLYFAGERSWFNNRTYKSPIDIRCRPNFIILVTDGESTRDQDPRLRQKNGYIRGGTIGDYDGDGREEGTSAQKGSDYVDDVAAFLYQNDLMPRMGVGDLQYEKQHIITHTIGFRHSHRLLQETAGNGGGRYFTTSTGDGLARAFEIILNDAENTRNIYAAPSVPVSRMNGVYAGDYLYLGMFMPAPGSGRWRGNLKKYKIDTFGRLFDQNNRPATDPGGVLVDSAQSFWSDGADGAVVDAGGAGELLVRHPSRRLYTYLPGRDQNLTAEINAFSIDNEENIPLTVLGVATDDQRREIINDARGVGKEWIMGDVLHSEPVVVRYDTNGDGQMAKDDDALVFVGTNTGVMHAIRESSGREEWGFIPPQHLGRLQRLSADDNIHDYFVDGPPVVVSHGQRGSEKKTLVFGDRRGGNTYTALDITLFDRPLWKYSVGEDILGEDGEKLGQSWGRPRLATIATGPKTTCQVLLLPGGYDTNQDASAPAGRDTRGRAVFSVMLDSGRLGPFHFLNDGQSSDMTHCIVDVVGIDPDGDGIVNSIYAPDLQGNMFAFNDAGADGSWRKLRLFNASDDGIHRKIFYSPDVVRIAGDPSQGNDGAESTVGEMIYFGTGDRAHPNETRVKNRFYAIKNYWSDAQQFTTLTDRIDANGDGDLHDATQNLIVQGTAAQRAAAEEEIESRLGWFIELASEGEKVVSSPVVYNQTVYFTTYAPPSSPDAVSGDACRPAGDGGGSARLYGVDYRDGRAVHDSWSAIKEHLPESGEEIRSGGKADRYIEIGRSMPSAPIVAIRKGVAMLYVGVAGKLVAVSPKKAIEMNIYYWREIKP